MNTWQTTVNKSGRKDRVDETNIHVCALQVVSTMVKIFGSNPLAWSDSVWEEWITPWQEQYIRNFFLFDGLVTVEDLNQEIESMLEGDSDNG